MVRKSADFGKKTLQQRQPKGRKRIADAFNSSFSTYTAKRKDMSHAKKSIPNVGEKYVEVVAALVNKASPRKKASLSKRGVELQAAGVPDA